MRRVALVGLAVLTAVSGCVNPHGHKPVAELGPGITPITSTVRYDATYALLSTDRPGEVLYTTHLVRGERVGFRRELGQPVVAVAGGVALPLGDGTYAWVIPDGARPNWRARASQDWRAFGKGVATVLIFVCIVVLGLLFVAAA
jgi:hypothetical protein